MSRFLTWFVLLAGVWLILAPFSIGYLHMQAAHAIVEDVAAGVALVVVSLWSAAAPEALPGRGAWATTVIGIWIILAPTVIGYGAGSTADAAINDIAVGIIVLSLGLLRVFTARAQRVS
jgi:hypothetical protein